MMKTKTAILATLAIGAVNALAGTPTPAPVGKAPVCCPPPAMSDPCAGPISYNNVELLYAYTDIDGAGDSADGGILRAEWSPMEHFYLTASAQYHEVSNIEMWAFTAGVGGYMPLTQNVHIAVDGGAVWANIDVAGYYDDPTPNDVSGYSDDEVGWYVRPHVRAKFGCLEVHVGALYTEIDDINGGDFDEWAGFANFYYQVAPQWDVTAGVTYSSDRTTVTGGARYRF